MAATETAAEPEAEQEEADQMRDTDEVSATGLDQSSPTEGPRDSTGEESERGGPRPLPLNWSEMPRIKKKKWKKWGGRWGLGASP